MVVGRNLNVPRQHPHEEELRNVRISSQEVGAALLLATIGYVVGAAAHSIFCGVWKKHVA